MYIVYWYNRNMCVGLDTASTLSEDNFEFSIHTFANVYKIIATSIGLLSLYVGIIAMKNKTKISIVGITLSIILIIISLLPICNFLFTKKAI